MFRTAKASALFALAGLLGCASDSTPVPPGPTGEVAASSKQRVLAPRLGGTDLAEVVSGNATFAFDLYRSLRAESGNLFFSPHSISLALAMAHAGARGGTEQELAKALHFTLPQGALHAAMNALDLELARRGEAAKGKSGRPFRLNVANAAWGQKGYDFDASYLDTLAENYGAGVRLVNFRDQPEPSRVTINDWVAGKTNDKIKDLLPEGAVTDLTRLVLTNAIYFNAAWEDKFDPAQTRRDEFVTADGKTVMAPMMSKTYHYGHGKDGGAEAVELAYDGQELSMLLVRPETGSFSDFEARFDDKALSALLRRVQPTMVELHLPKFRIEGALGLKKQLQALGMQQAFSGAADFSGILGRKELYISDVLHKAFVAVDEAGTEAAAATAVVMAGSAQVDPVRVFFNRPFLFLVRDKQTGAILFLGRVLDPTAESIRR